MWSEMCIWILIEHNAMQFFRWRSFLFLKCICKNHYVQLFTRMQSVKRFLPLCVICTYSGYHSGKGHCKGSTDKIALFASPDKVPPKPEVSPGFCCGCGSLTDMKAVTKTPVKQENSPDADSEGTRTDEGVDKNSRSKFLSFFLV